MRLLAVTVFWIVSHQHSAAQQFSSAQCQQLAVAVGEYAFSLLRQKDAMFRLDLHPVRDRVNAPAQRAIADFEASTAELRAMIDRHSQRAIDLTAAIAHCDR